MTLSTCFYSYSYTVVTLLVLLLGITSGPTGTTASPNEIPVAAHPALGGQNTTRKQGGGGSDEDLGSLVIGGVNAEKGRYPYMVNLNSPGKADNYCGGTLIAPNVVLSAAHCKGATKVTIGRYNVDKQDGDLSSEYELLNVEQERIHPGYKDKAIENDIMLLKLSKPSSKPTVAIDYDGSANLNRNTELRLMGWGSIRKNRIRLPDILQEADLDYVTSSDCSDKYEDVDGAYITEDMMCAARKGKGACSGDSGGPLIIPGMSDSSDVQVGVVNWAVGCANRKYPGVYSKISESWDDFIRPRLETWGVDITSPGSPDPSPPSPDPPTAPPAECFLCQDKADYLSKGRQGKDCTWVGKRASRCNAGKNVIGCPKTCGVC